MRPAFAAAVFVAAVQSLAIADTYTVGPGGDFADLQTAIDSVPDGSTLLVSTVERWPIVIDGKSLAILGGTIDASGNFSGTTSALDVRNCAWVYLQDMTIGSTTDMAYAVHGLSASKVGDLRVVRCALSASPYRPDWYGDCDATQPGTHAPGHGAVLTDVGRAHFEDCALAGANAATAWAWEWNFARCDPAYGDRGGDGLLVTRSLALLEGGQSIGGRGGDIVWGPNSGDCSGDFPPTDLQAGDGGNGITGRYFGSGVFLAGGAGGARQWNCTDWGIGSDGNPGGRDDGRGLWLPDTLEVTPVVAPGGVAWVVGGGLPPFAPVELFSGLGLLPSPVRLPQGWWFVQPPFVHLDEVTTDAAGTFALRGTIPDDPALVGLSLWIQAALQSPGMLSEPAAVRIASL